MSPPRHRRDFVRAVALGAAGLPAAALADDGPKKDAPPTKAPLSEPDARMELILARFGTLLDGPAREAVRAEVGSITARAQSLRKFELDNGDGPFPVFHPYRAPLT